jgi:hypothetical protein
MMQVHRDMLCTGCGSVNEHEQVTKNKDLTRGNVVEMVIRCKKCGHEYLQGTLTQWSDTDEPMNFNVTEWGLSQIEEY